MPGRNKPSLTPIGRALLDATARGRVTYWPYRQVVVMRTVEGPSDVTRQFTELMQYGFGRIEPYDLERPPPPEVMCHVTPAGEEALMEARQAAKNKKTSKKEGARR